MEISMAQYGRIRGLAVHRFVAYFKRRPARSDYYNPSYHGDQFILRSIMRYYVWFRRGLWV